jgi:hypothetical protein
MDYISTPESSHVPIRPKSRVDWFVPGALLSCILSAAILLKRTHFGVAHSNDDDENSLDEKKIIFFAFPSRYIFNFSS